MGTLSSFGGIPDYSPNHSPHSVEDDIHLISNNTQNTAAQIYEMHTQQMLSPPNGYNIQLNEFNIDIDHAFKHQHTMDIVSDSDDTDSLDINIPFEYQSDIENDDNFTGNLLTKLTLNNAARESHDINEENDDDDEDNNNDDADDKNEDRNDENEYFRRMQPMSLAHTQNSNEIDIKIDLNGYRDSGDSQIVYELIADSTSPNYKKHDDKDHNEDMMLFDNPRINKLINNRFPSKDFPFMKNIGRGAYGVVDKSFHLKSCQIVAIKRSRSPKKKMMN